MNTCPIDQADMVPLFSHTILGRHLVQYFTCPSCGLIQTENPHWLEEAYSNAIVASDTGIMKRNLINAWRVSAVLCCLGRRRDTIVDMAGGYGILTRLLRDIGFEALWTDPYCENTMARGFETKHNTTADVLCAFEVLEHVYDPVDFLSSSIDRFGSEVLICSTELVHGTPDRDWWYYGFETGQHITFYSELSMKLIADRLGYHYLRLAHNLHLFTRSRISPLRRMFLKSNLTYPYGLWAMLWMRKKSKTVLDKDQLLSTVGGVERQC